MNVPKGPGLSYYAEFDRRPSAAHTPSLIRELQSVITSVGNISL